MKFQVSVNIEKQSPELDKLIEYIYSEGTPWEVIPGSLVQERIFTNLKTLYRFFDKCEKIYQESLNFNIQILPKDSEEDEEMILLYIEDINKNII